MSWAHLTLRAFPCLSFISEWVDDFYDFIYACLCPQRTLDHGKEVSWAHLTLRLRAPIPGVPKLVEHEWTVGPIPFKDGLGREVVIRHATSLSLRHLIVA